MPKQKTDDLVQLIRSLTKAEKRHFRLSVGQDDLLFVSLFNFLDKRGEYDEAAILKKIPKISKNQLPNLKAHLYKQLLTSLRRLAKNDNEDIRLREMLDYARVLYNKCLYRPALDMLAKTRERALQSNYFSLALEAIEFEKMIEGQYITRSIAGRADELDALSVQITRQIEHNNRYSNLALLMYALYLKTGFVRNQAEYREIKAFFESKKPCADYESLDFWGKIHYCQAHMWLYHISQEFAHCYRFAQRWVDLFRSQPAMIELNAPLYLKGLHNLLSTLFNGLSHRRFRDKLEILTQFPSEYNLSRDQNVAGLYHLYRYIHIINLHYLEARFTEGLHLVPTLLRHIKADEYNWDNHRIMVFYYRCACLYFGAGDFSRAIDFLNIIIQSKQTDYRTDIQSFARILSLIAHFELGNLQLLEYQIKSVYRYLLQMENVQEVQKEILRFLRRIPGMLPADLLPEFRRLHDKLSLLEKDPFERRPFLYLDIISWLESKLENRPVEAVMQEKFRKREKRAGALPNSLKTDFS